MSASRLAANFVAYSDDPASSAHYKARLKDELAMLSRDYSVLLYGGHMDLEVAAYSATGHYDVGKQLSCFESKSQSESTVSSGAAFITIIKHAFWTTRYSKVHRFAVHPIPRL